jgi:histone arginine demethylase JMJD6
LSGHFALTWRNLRANDDERKMLTCNSRETRLEKERTSSIPKLAEFDKLTFTANFLRPNLPVVYEGYACEWPAVQKWNPDFFLENYGSIDLPVAGRREIRLSDYIRSLKKSRAIGALPYLRNIWLAECFPELVSDVRVPEMAAPNWLTHPLVRPFLLPEWLSWFEFFLSAPRTRFPFVHRDVASTHAWLLQIYGEKKIWMWPSELIPPREGNIQRAVTRDENLDRFFPGHVPATTVLKPGDILFIPAGWWHTVESQSISITLSGNFVNQTNWDAFFASYFQGEERAEAAQSGQAYFARMSRKIIADYAGDCGGGE